MKGEKKKVFSGRVGGGGEIELGGLHVNSRGGGAKPVLTKYSFLLRKE